MKQLSKIQSILFLIGGVLMVIGAGCYAFLLGQKVVCWVYLVGALLFAWMQTGGQRGEKCAGKIVTAAGKIDRADAQAVQMAARSFGIVIAAVAAQLDHDVFRAEPAEDLRRGDGIVFAGELPGLAHAGKKVVQMCKIGCDLRKRSVRRGRGRIRCGQRAAGPRPPQHLRRERAAAEQAVDAHELCLPQKLVRYVRVAEGGVRAERGNIGGFVVPLNQIYDRSRAALRVDDKRVRVNAAAL